jgi:putative ABC transport system permease protein
MNSKLVNFIIRKYLKFDHKNPFISISAILAFIGVAVGVMVLIIAMAIMNGTSKEFEDKLFTMNYPLSVYPKFEGGVDKKLLLDLEKKFPNMLFSPYLSSQVMIQGDGSMSGGVIFGVDPKREATINKIYKKAYDKITKFNKYDLIVGDGIKKDLTLYSKQKVTLYFTKLNPSGFSMIPQLKRFNYKASFKSGLTSYDSAYMYTTISALQTMLQKSKTTYDGIHIYSNNPMEDIKKIRKAIPQFSVGVIGWWQQNGNFFSAMELEKQALFLVLMLIILIASLNIISSLLMTVMSRRKEIALLLSMGATQKEIKQIFFKLGSIIGIGGILTGVAFGFFGMFILGHFDIISLPADVYGTSKLPLVLNTVDFISIVIGSIVIVLASSYYPAYKATKIDVLEVLRNE